MSLQVRRSTLILPVNVPRFVEKAYLRNADAIMERARDLHAGSIEAAPVGLREIFLQKVKED